MSKSEEKNPSKINVKLSKIQFPEICPVCLKEAEDLVFATVIEKANYDYTSSSWARSQDKSSVALEAAQGAVTFAIPTCMLHGSSSVRTFRKKIIAALGFFVLFYPILYFLLQINVALGFSRPLLQPVIGLITTSAILVILLLYGLFPRALERVVRFDDVSRVKDMVLLSISNMQYRNKFMELNIISADNVNDEPTENRG